MCKISRKTLDDKVVLVTGGGSGIGRASALAFAREGAKVVVADVDIEAAEATVRAILSAGHKAVSVMADVSNSAEVEAMVEFAVGTYGRLDCAHNNAGIEPSGRSTVELSEDEWDRHMSVNLKSVWLCMKYEIPHMLRQDKGVIVNTASVSGLVASMVGSEYSASKHGVVGLTKAVALEYAMKGIRVNAVCPAPTRTQMIERVIRRNPTLEAQYAEKSPMARMAAAEEIAEVVVWLCSDAASFVTGVPMLVDGGWVAR